MRKNTTIFDDLLFYFVEQEEPEEDPESLPKKETSEEMPPEQELPPEGKQGYEETPTTPENEVEDPEEKLSDLDKVIRLKKIYVRLLAISNILDHYSDDEFDDLRNDILEALDLFHVIVSNFDNFRDKIDDIIDNFYKLLKSSISEVDKLTKKTGD